MAGNPSTTNEGPASNSGTTVPATPPAGSGSGKELTGSSPPSDQSFHHFRQHEDHETDPVTPNDDTASFVVDEDAASAAENSSIVTRSSSARFRDYQQHLHQHQHGEAPPPPPPVPHPAHAFDPSAAAEYEHFARPAHENGVSPGLQYSPRGRGNDWAAAAAQTQWITDHNGTPIVWTPGQHAHNPHHAPPPPATHDHRFVQNRWMQHEVVNGRPDSSAALSLAAAAAADPLNGLIVMPGGGGGSELTLDSPRGVGSRHSRSSSKLHSPLSQTTESTVIPDDTLSMLTVKELNKRVQNLTRDEVVALKQRRRTLKNRGYAFNCRLRRQQHKETLEVQVSNLHERLRKMTDERNFYRNQFEKVQSALHQTTAGNSSPAAAAAAAAAAAVAASQHGQDLTLQQHGSHHNGGGHLSNGEHMNNGGNEQLDLSIGGANHDDYKRYPSHHGALLHHAAAAAAVEIKPNRW